ncbi:MAG: ABC transporter permease subunit [Gemmataceae bacterium]
MNFLGPVFWHDLVRVARRQRLALWRAIYGLALLLALALVYANTMPPSVWLGGHLRPGEEAAFADGFLTVFTVAQFAAVILLTPALAANALAEEKTHNTLIFLFTTQLTSREIVLGKLVTRLMHIGSLVLTGLPVLAILQFLGGVDLPKVVASFAAVAVTAVSLASIGLACAVFTRKPQNAPWRAYQIVLAYAALSSVCIWAYELPWGSTFAGRTVTRFALPGGITGVWAFTPTLPPQPWDSELVEPFNYANPYYAYRRIWTAQQLGADTNTELLKIGSIYVATHLVIAALFSGLAIARLRVATAKTLGGSGLTHKNKAILKAAPHPPIRNRPVLWKELYCESKPRQRWLALLFTRWFFVASFLPAWVIIVLLLDNSFSKLASYTLLGLRYGGTLVACGLIVRVGLQAARSIGSERDRETFDSMMTTALEPDEIVNGKWWGSFLSGRWMVVWLLVHWGLGVLALAVSPFAVPLLILGVLVFAAFAVSLGMFCAAHFPRTKQAASVTLMILLFATTLMPWTLGKITGALMDPQPAFSMGRPWQRPQMPWPEALAGGLTPPRALASCVIESDYFQGFGYYYRPDEDRFSEMAVPIAIGLMVYGGLAIVLAALAHRAFRASLPGHRRGNAGPRAASRIARPQREPVEVE